MNINGDNINIDDLYDSKYMHKEIKKGLFLSEYQVEVLKRFGIDPEKCSGIDDVLFQIDDILDEDDDEELDLISREIHEFNYYHNTNK